MTLRVACALLLLVAAGAGQTKAPRKKAAAATAPAAATGGFVLERVKVEGNANYSAEQVIAASGLKIGQPVKKADFDAARERLTSLGVFDNAGYQFDPSKDGKGYDAVLQVSEILPVLPVRFEALGVPDADLNRWLREKDPMYRGKAPATQQILKRYTDYVSEYMAGHDFHDKVIAKVVPEDTELAILFRAATPNPSINLVNFTNTGELAAPQLTRDFYGVAVGTVYSEKYFRTLLDLNIRPKYEAKGRIAVQFPKIDTTPATDVKGVNVVVKVEEGPVYKFGKVGYSGVPLPKTQVAKLLKLPEGDVANFDLVKAGQTAIEKAMKRDGYLKVESAVKRLPHEAEKTVDVTYAVQAGPQYTFGKLTVVGLDIETEPEIRKMWGLEPGKPFNADYPERFLGRVKEDGVFENLKNTRFETKNDDAAHKVDVTLYFNK